MADRVEQYCSMSVAEVNEYRRLHPSWIPLTEERMLWQCFEGAYMVTLLRLGYSFHDNQPHLVFTRDLAGETLSWALGAVSNAADSW